MNRYIGLLVIVGGLCLVFAGLLIYTGWLSWFGRLPGDIRYESDNVNVYVPIVSMLVVSLALIPDALVPAGALSGAAVLIALLAFLAIVVRKVDIARVAVTAIIAGLLYAAVRSFGTG